MKKSKKILTVLGLFGNLLFLSACSVSAEEGKLVTLGVVGENQEVWDFIADKLEKEQDITLKLVKFTDYAQPNKALNQKEINLNAFQHQLYLDSFNEDSGTNLVAIGKTVIAPLGIYSDYKSLKEGLHHACGHDGHTAALLGAVKILTKHKAEFAGTIKFAFQQAEEIGAGARQFVQNGVLDDVDEVFGLHLDSSIPVGKIAFVAGPTNASCDIFKIKIA